MGFHIHKELLCKLGVPQKTLGMSDTLLHLNKYYVLRTDMQSEFLTYRIFAYCSVYWSVEADVRVWVLAKEYGRKE